ncbi:MAG: tetratricopeptide repeat protein [Candidatus Competibacteraceae bacterium]|jgi:tetratricopeptide (TPR) repeat protein|nr:tetratricopeptide repeat protein [Candidatus Competibacteraceae bacterium]
MSDSTAIPPDFSQQLLQLPLEDRKSLTILAILQTPFREEEAKRFLLPDSVLTLDRWHELGLLQVQGADEQGHSWFLVRPTVQHELLRRIDETKTQVLHLRAAEYYGCTFLNEAHRVLEARGQTPSEETIAALAWGEQGVLQSWTARDTSAGRWALQQGLEWQRHLFASRQVQAAGQVINALAPALLRGGKGDQAEVLLRQGLAEQQGLLRARTLTHLGMIRASKNEMREAFSFYDQAHQQFVALGLKPQIARAIERIAGLHATLRDHDQAIKKQEAALKMHRAGRDELGQLTNLRQLATFYRNQGSHQTALARSQDAEFLARKLRNDQLSTVILNEQGIILLRLKRQSEALEKFQRSLDIARQIGNDNAVADSLTAIGKTLFTENRLAEARAALEESSAIRQRLQDPRWAASLETLGLLDEQQGLFSAALEKLQHARTLYEKAIPQALPQIETHIARVQGKV